jgi:uncharacterized membrane protein
MTQSPEMTAKRFYGAEWKNLSAQEREVIEAVLHRINLPRNVNKVFANQRTFGDRASDTIAAFGGSWTFILLFFSWLIFWSVLDTDILGPRNEAFDPYPYVFLNLILSMLAAIQAPIIMMSQNRQVARDRIDAEVDHEVNVRAELAIHQLDERLHAIEGRLADVASIMRNAPAASDTGAD